MINLIANGHKNAPDLFEYVGLQVQKDWKVARHPGGGPEKRPLQEEGLHEDETYQTYLL